SRLATFGSSDGGIKTGVCLFGNAVVLGFGVVMGRAVVVFIDLSRSLVVEFGSGV
ncbi:hypothetical protein A2U01_0067271, partial [Trifolium medium]|nr:hypothetical protein [Trifolium medium]